ncbi:MaoC dehydratase-like protein [Jatrophihabitans sp. GAS493]|uniref:MaoC family dehydratase n=1 Tax=Jatrophihabitans sp. GAS493 TaxID=1907575 RepID=UPI000BC081C1|nr:MaoC dehydratase-like protein [Jatrophihabitans sp. GAS493]
MTASVKNETSLPPKIRALSAPPKMGPLFLRAALGARGPHGKTTPSTVFTLNDQKIDAAHLAAYQSVCGFGGRDELPVTYLHVLAFPLQMSLMVEPEFPFPAPGTVHVNNTISQLRPVTLDEVVNLRVHAENLRPHDSGRQIDLVSQAFVGDELVWTDRSTYLRRGKPSGSAGEKSAGEKSAGEKSEAKPKVRPVEQLPGGVAALIKVPGDIGRKYAGVSGDSNPIHLHNLTAKAFGFKGAIAHGMWLKARTIASLEGRLPDSFTVDVAFKTPVFLPSRVALRSEQHRSAGASRTSLDVRNAKSGKPHLSGTVY